MQCVVPEKWSHVSSSSLILKIEMNALVSVCFWRSYLSTFQMPHRLVRQKDSWQPGISWLLAASVMRWHYYTQVLTILKWVLEKGRMQDCLELLSVSLVRSPVVPFKLCICWGSKEELSFFLLVKFPVEHGRQGHSLGFRIQQMMGQKVMESSITKPGPVLGAPGKTPHTQTIIWGNCCLETSACS